MLSKFLFLIFLFLSSYSFASPRIENKKRFPSITDDGTSVVVDASSFTWSLQAGATAWIDSPSFRFAQPSSGTACHNIYFTPNGNNPQLLSSAPTTATSLFNTINATYLNTTNAKAALLRCQNVYVQDGTGAAQVLILHARTTGSGLAASVNTERCYVEIAAASERSADTQSFWIQLDANKDFDFSCFPDNIETFQRCKIYLEGWCE